MARGVICMLVALMGTPAIASPLPRYEPGVAFIYDNGRVEQVRDVKGQTVTWAARSGRTYSRSVNPVTPILSWSFRGETGSRRVLGDPDRLWPLRPGATTRFRSVNDLKDARGRNRRSVHLWTCTVLPRQTAETPAGRFEVTPIQCDRFSSGTMRILERITWSHSEEIGHYVVREVRDMRDGDGEVIRLHAVLPAWEANPVRVEALAREARAAPSD
jgi:hypothetical protein